MTSRLWNPDGADSVLRGYNGRILLLLTIGYAAMQTGRMALSPLLPTIIEQFSISAFKAGLVLSVLLWCNALMQFPSGRLSDRLSRKTIVAVAFGAAIAGFVLLSVATTYVLLLSGAAIIGVATGLYPAAALAWLSDLFEDRRGQAFGVNTAAIDTGSALSAGVATAVLYIGAWRAAFLPIAVVMGVVILYLHRWGREPYVVERFSLEVGRTARSLFRTRQMRWTLVCYSLYMFTWQGVAGFLPTYLQVEKGFSPVVASSGFAALFVVGMAVKPVVGALGDREAHAPVAAGVLVVGSVGLVGMLVSTSTVGTLAGVVVFAVGLMGFSPPMLVVLTAQFPDDTLGADLGAARAVYIGVGSLGPVLVGYVASTATYTAAFTVLLGCLVGSLFVLVYLVRSPTVDVSLVEQPQ